MNQFGINIGVGEFYCLLDETIKKPCPELKGTLAMQNLVL